ncbi:MAG: adenosylcobinamide-phosphate synthase CbiB [Halofilum sp. (in: g-proteobacteria)]
MQTGLVIAAALLADALLGEMRRGHPLVGFGMLAARVERAFNRRDFRPRLRRFLGGVGLVLLVVPFVVAAVFLAAAQYGWAFEILVLYLALGLRSLGEHAGRVQRALGAEDLESARAAVGRMVSRDVRALDRRGVAAAAIESVLENGNDAVFGTLFWFLVAGAPGAVAYRLVNTLDAMWGYRTERLAAFGWAAARLDDVINWPAARLAALTYGLVGLAPLRALRCARRQGGRTDSPNAGVVMAAGAGALGVRIGGPGVYHGRRRWRPRFGVGRRPDGAAIGAAVGLVINGALLWTAIACIAGWWFA